MPPRYWHDDYESLGYIDDDYGTYHWSCVGVFRRKSDGMLFFDEDCGCSCNGPFDQPELEDLRPLDGHEDDFLEACSNISKFGHQQGQELLLKLRTEAA